MSDMWSNCFSFVLVTSTFSFVFQNCKEILSAPSWFLLDKDLVLGLWCTQTLKLLVILHLALFNYFSIITADQNNSFHGQIQECYWSNLYLEVADQSIFTSTHHSDDDVCYVWGLPYKLCIYKVFMFILYRNRYTYLKVSS